MSVEVMPKKPRNKRVLGLQPNPRHYLLTFTVIMGQSMSDSNKKFTRSKTIPFSSELKGLEFAKEARNCIIAHAKEYFVYDSLKGLVTVLSLTYTFQELP